ncbi:hypothetical protein KAZ93_02075 [Patescibacteria group bacterium]|nr:hypothetical protein [Patescibacteria group bacterium]
MRFLGVRYKIYSLIVITILVLIYTPVSDTLRSTWANRQSLDQIDNQITMIIARQEKYKQEEKMLTMIETQRDILVNCINKESQCDQLDESITKNLPVIKTYIQLGNLTREKMDVDEAKILKIINEFLTQKDFLSTKRSYNGIVNDILIADSIPLENNIVKVPISLRMTFDSKEDLLIFLENVENRVFTDSANNTSVAVLFEIGEIGYDIVNYQDSQDVSIDLLAYAYKN